MACAKTLFIALLVGCLVVVGYAHTDSVESNSIICSTEDGNVCGEAAAGHDRSALSRLIQSASPDALHKFLHTVTGFQHGVFDSDEAAVEAVLELDPTLSSTVAQLQRRQNGTTTESSPPVNSPTTSSTPTTTLQTSTTTEQPSSTPVVTPPETSPSATPTATETSTTPTQAPSSTQPTNTEPTLTSPTGTTTTTSGTTNTNRPVTSPKTNTLTSTLPGGAVTTMTSVKWVTPGVPETPTTANTAEGSLQSGMAVAGRRGPLLEVLVGGAAAIVGGAMLV
ncbi:hypothetical protein Micbo1qcDRAFT_173795 [Microdochium bolleyi]|uniref:Uncharacterized protein n=1 Tax=Microdochium bolleyi TaxID=196109 RepID=A0A136J5Z3_9PEZI|nr:hypothetical protein Micbo1qcDRAFT_173795 [Microdochium bolleyi]